MVSIAHLRTLFHLVPTNQVAHEALLHADNVRFVSNSRDGRPGLEVGYHVPSIPAGHIITRLGRNADLILHQSNPTNPMSAVHVAFEVNPATELVVLSVRSKRLSSVRFAPRPDEDAMDITDDIPGSDEPGQEITGDGVILYGQDYKIFIAAYRFELIWRIKGIDALRSLTVQGYQEALRLLKDVRSRDCPTEPVDSEVLSWHMTRLDTAKGPLFKDIAHLREEAHIIEYLGHQHFHTPRPEIFMPLREGSLTSLINKDSAPSHDDLCAAVLRQMLSALDYLASENLMHRDWKPDNILYYTLPEGGFHFQLADFGLANYLLVAKTPCGTGYFQAPELRPETSKVFAPQSHKMDIWSLFATMVAIYTRFREFPPLTVDYSVILKALQAKALGSRLEPMGRLHPDRRASAAQMLAQLFDGWGLTTPRSKIPPLLPPKAETISQVNPSPTAMSGSPDGNDHSKSPQRQKAGSRPLVVYPPRGTHPKRPSPHIPPVATDQAGDPEQPAAL
ncbi:hypothetical protein SAPIO_CDS3923 [Scedosporium apiospermum]|uniref:Protein kinase domain-containing protein n=1 Tax=Pseudallescheria apiosperma TaxID=563466 RepID=A0A084G8W5_PSEDA|nr:uncharacterized protein SAPIO_CDS3923 [Scedosporium apiospermum]KEZ43777.1 hypothetical protein SAPIO_CDS3923 [Scedosporium apiospermum]